MLSVGVGSAQLLLVVSSPQSSAPFPLISALNWRPMVTIGASAQQRPDPAVPHRVSYRDLYRNPPLGVVAVAASGPAPPVCLFLSPFSRLKTASPPHPCP